MTKLARTLGALVTLLGTAACSDPSSSVVGVGPAGGNVAARGTELVGDDGTVLKRAP